MGEERAMNPAAPDGELDRAYRTVFDDVSRVIYYDGTGFPDTSASKGRHVPDRAAGLV